ncbi:hypothetical protein FACS1894186_0550 [Alphaproteobacteria bacterium]|nr:hypothetical protein FACS1894186_0550 [Alphaproteobacteria bacterium]
MIINDAFAQTAADAAAGAGGAAGAGVKQIVMFILIFAAFYFLFARPQNKKIREREQMLKAIAAGDRVITGGGVHGRVVRVIDDANLAVEVAPGVVVEVLRDRLFSVPDKDPAMLAALAAEEKARARVAKLQARGKGGKPDVEIIPTTASQAKE